MVQVKRILCPIDFSEFSMHALEQAVALAHASGAEITTVHVFVAPDPIAELVPVGGAVALERVALSAGYRRQLETELTEFVAPVKAGGVPVTTRIGQGAPATVIVDTAAAIHADLIVMGTHGRSGFQRLLLGSVTEKVLRKAGCPVLTVPRRAANTTELTFENILCAIDFSQASLHALDIALSMADECHGRLTVINVLELLPEGSLGIDGQPVLDTTDLRAELEQNARQQMAAAIPDARRHSCDIQELITMGRPYREILRVAEQERADLIVVGVQGRGAVDLAFFGSTTQHIVRQAAVPVLSIRAENSVFA